MTRNPGSEVYSGSTCKQGEIEAVVIATGVNTFFGKAAHLVENTTHVGHFQKVRNFKVVCLKYKVNSHEKFQIVDLSYKILNEEVKNEKI